MSQAKEIMNSQKQKYISGFIQGFILMLIGIYGGIMILRNGIGVAPSKGIASKIYGMMSNIMSQGENAANLVLICFSGVFFIIGAIGLYYIIRAGSQIPSKKTMLGKSILLQVKGNDSFENIVDSIDADMENEPNIFDKVYIGRKWILEMEVMRISDIRGVFWLDNGSEDYVLCCVDESQNIWAASMTYADDRDSAMECLCQMLPDVVSGDVDAYKAFLRGETIEEQEDELTLAKPLSIPQDTKFTFIKPDGIPTSNFVYEDVLQALLSLNTDCSIALKPLTSESTKVLQLGFRRNDEQQWIAYLIYIEYGDECAAVKMINASEAEKILHDFMEKKCLPDLARWSAAEITK